RDIYSFGVIMWEILTGEEAFNDYEFNTKLAIKICRGLRPEFAPGDPECYVELAKKCMDSDPKKRPAATYVNAERSKFQELANESNETIIKKQFLEADEQSLEADKRSLEGDKMVKKLSSIVQKSQDHNKYTSKLINTQDITKAFSKMAIVSAPIDNVEIPIE
ncbi:2326_t:CDS:2, partial [Cetraspora pellucida]